MLRDQQEELEALYTELANSGLEDYSLPQTRAKTPGTAFAHLLRQKGIRNQDRHLEEDLSAYLRSAEYLKDQTLT